MRPCVVALLMGSLLAAAAVAQPLPPVPVPGPNPITEPKRVLGKILFWDEQLSSDDTVACGTCHLTERAGADPRPALHPGPDGSFGTFDDIHGSRGVARRDASGAQIPDPSFGFDPQVTSRSAQSSYGGLFAPENFWDGRAQDSFDDPLTGTPVLLTGGALENQALGPILSDVEMAKQGRTWSEVTAKLAAVTPLALASDLPPDVAAALVGGVGYPALFQAAFGDPAITPVRIAFAIASYERTLVADQTPWDLFIAGDSGAMTASQQQGWAFFQGSACLGCHTPPVFTNDAFFSIGVRPVSEDIGRGAVTLQSGDDGLFKTPTLRNLAAKPFFMHNGSKVSVNDAVTFYLPTELHFPTNLDPRIPVSIPTDERAALVDFVKNALTDPRVSAGEFPFDRPTLRSEQATQVPALPVVLVPLVGALMVLVGRSQLRGRLSD